MSAKYQIGSLVEFSRDKYTEQEGEYMPYNEKYFKGKQGYVISVSDTKVSTAKNLEELADSGGEYMYSIRIGLTDIVNVPESDIFNPNQSIQEKVEKRLRDKQAKKEFKDTEGRIGGSKKEKRAYQMVQLADLNAIEEDEATAIELIKKDKVYPKVDITAERNNGTSSGATFLKVKLREAFGNEPPNGKEKRKLYVGYAEHVVSEFKNVVTVEGFEKKARSLTSDEGFKTLVKILRPELLPEIEDNEFERERIEKERDIVRGKISDEIERLQKKFPDKTFIQITETEDATYHNELEELSSELQSEISKKGKSINEIEKSFLASIGNNDWYYSIGSVIRKILEEVIGKRFVNFISKGSNPVKETFETAEKLEELSVAQSILLIEQKTEWPYKNLDKYEEIVRELDNLVTKDQYDAFFEKHGSFGFKGGVFAKWGSKYFYYKDIKGVEQIEAYTTRFRSHYSALIHELKQKIEKIKDEYKPRETNWDWAFDKKKAGSEKKEKTELKVNTYPPLSYIKRTGGVKILDSDITPESIREKFGFKEVEFGQSLQDKEAKEHVRHFLGAMADLADVLNMSVIELNKLGGLSIAFASRGGGKASAHYESLRKVINVTKTRGGGAIAHEYMHYLDNILPKINREEYSYKDWASVIKESRYGRREGSIANQSVFKAVDDIFEYIYKRRLPDSLSGFSSADKKNTVTKTIEASTKGFSLPQSFYESTGYVTPTDIDTYYELFVKRYSQYRFLNNLKKRDIEILGAIVQKFGFKSYEFPFEVNSSMYYANSVEMGSDYWSRAWELFARAFETYIYDKLNNLGRANNYLVSGAYFDRPEGVYPQEEERSDLFILFDHLMKTIKKEYEISDFVAWTTERVDEYIALEGDKKETVESGVIVDQETDEVIEKIGNTDSIKNKLRKLIELLETEKMSFGGLIGQDSMTDKFSNFILTL